MPNLVKEVKDTYDKFVDDYFIPHWSNIRTMSSLITDFKRGDKRKERMNNLLLEVISPLLAIADKAEQTVSDLNIPVRTVDDPTCLDVNLYPFTNYFTGIKDLKESFLFFTAAIPKIAKFEYSQKGKDNFYKFPNSSGSFDYFSQAVLNIKVGSKFLVNEQTQYRQTYLLAEAGANKSILKFKTLGFNNELSDSKFTHDNKDYFYNEIQKVIPVGKLKDKIKKGLDEIFPYVKKNPAYLGYKYLLTQKGFKLLQDRVTAEANAKVGNKGGNYDYIYNLLSACMRKKDPNYNNKVPCTGHLKQFKKYLKFRASPGGGLIAKDTSDGVIHNNFPKVDKAIRHIAEKLTFILLDNENYYKHVDKMDADVRRMFYKTKFILGPVTKDKREDTVNNSKYAIFKSLSGIKLFDSTIRTEQGEEVIFKEIAPIFLTYLLYYSMQNSDHESKYIDSNGIEDYLYFYALFKSPEHNHSVQISPTKIEKSTGDILKKINFFEFHFNNVHNNKLMCDKEGQSLSKEERIKFVE